MSARQKRNRTCPLETDSNQPKSKKFDHEQSHYENRITFTLDEKYCFLKACQENGLNVIYDIKKLKEYLPARTENEIKYLVEVTARKSKTRREGEDCKDTPLEIWYSLCDHLVRSQIKREDSSFCLIDLMERYESSKYGNLYNNIKQLMEGKYPSKLSVHDSIVFLALINELTQSVQSQDLSKVKDYIPRLHRRSVDLSSTLKVARSLGEEDCIECLSYFEQIDPIKLKRDIQQAAGQLNEVTENHQSNSIDRRIASRSSFYAQQATTSLRQHLRSANQVARTSSSDQANEERSIDSEHHSNEHVCQVEASRLRLSSISTTNTSSNQSAHQSSNQTIPSEENPLYYYSQLPRVRKIKECLNPLSIEIDMQKDLHSTLASTN